MYPSNPYLHTIRCRPVHACLAAAVCLILLAGSLPAVAQNGSGSVEIEEGGALWITGSASVVDYRCEAEKLSGNGSIENAEEPRNSLRDGGEVVLRVSIPVHSLDCGKRKMNRDMYEALKTDRYDTISYRLLEANTPQEDSLGLMDKQWIDIHTRGILEIAGVSDTTEVIVQGKLLGPDRLQVRGEKRVDMNAHNIRPPTAMFGLIRADNILTVHFNVTVRLSDL